MKILSWMVAAAAVVAFVSLPAGVVLAQTTPNTGPETITGAPSAAAPAATATTPAAAPTTTTTTLPSPSHALTKLINDVVAGQTARLIGPQVGQSLSMGAQQAVVDAGNGNADLAATDLQQVATTIATGVSGGHIAKGNGVLLQSDLTTLAKALGLGAAATPSSTTTSTSTSTTFNGNGNGNGNGGGPANGLP